VGRAGDARVASCEAAPDALAFRRSTVAVARHASLRIQGSSLEHALNERGCESSTTDAICSQVLTST
jgi:hypothetical protein